MGKISENLDVSAMTAVKKSSSNDVLSQPPDAKSSNLSQDFIQTPIGQET